MNSNINVTCSILILLAIAMAGCENNPPEIPDHIRGIKPYYVVEPAGGDVRRFSGSIVASDTSSISFAVHGTVATVTVNQGDHVTTGQVLATLDAQLYELNVDAARSQLVYAEANYSERQTTLDRQRQLFEKGWVAKAALEQSEAAFEVAQADVDLARSRLGSAERDLANTRLTAPFDGVIALRNAEPFEEVSVGQALFLLNSEGALEVELSVPDSIISRLVLGAPVIIDVPNFPACGCVGRLIEIGSSSGSANAVAVKAALLDPQPRLLPGMSAEVSITLSGGSEPRGFLVPLAAIVPGDENAQGYLFKFDANASVVHKVPVRSGKGVVENFVEIIEGVEAGDIVAAAGVSFLHDGQSVKLMGQ